MRLQPTLGFINQKVFEIAHNNSQCIQNDITRKQHFWTIVPAVPPTHLKIGGRSNASKVIDKTL